MGSSGKSSGGGGGGIVPGNMKKTVLEIKEVVNATEQEIYAVLKECGGDPNEAVERLLSQDTFHEVKSRREKKKEVKETSDTRPRGGVSSSFRGTRLGTDRGGGRGISIEQGQHEFGGAHVRASNKRENGTSTGSSYSSFGYGITGANANRTLTSASDPVPLESARYMRTPDEFIPLSGQPASGYQSAWAGVPGQRSLADIVRSGKQPNKTASAVVSATVPSTAYAFPPLYSTRGPIVDPSVSHTSYHDSYSSLDPPSKSHEVLVDNSWGLNQDTVADDGWAMVEEPLDSMSSRLGSIGAAEVYAEATTPIFGSDMENVHLSSKSELRIDQGVDTYALSSDKRAAVLTSNVQISDESPGELQSPKIADDTAAVISSNLAKLQQLRLHTESKLPLEDNPAVKIPSHIEATSADCSHLSFGSFRPGIGGGFSSALSTKALEERRADTAFTTLSTSQEEPANRSSEYYDDDTLVSASDETLHSRNTSGVQNYDSTSSSQRDVVNTETIEVSQGHQYPFSASIPNYSYENTLQSNDQKYAYREPEQQQGYGSSLPSNLSNTVAQLARESELLHAQLLSSQAMPTKYNTNVSSISGSSISVPEVGKSNVFTTQPTVQPLPANNLHTAATLLQHVPLQTYSQQPSLQMGPFSGVLGYPYLQQNYAYMPSGFQAYTANSGGYHASPAAAHGMGTKYTIPQYKSNLPISGLAHSASIAAAAGYGGFNSTANLPGSMSLNPSTSSTSGMASYEDLLNNQYKDASHFVQLQQNDSSGLWMQMPGGGRSVSPVPAPGNAFYTLGGQTQQSGFRQAQQPSLYATHGYLNLYQSGSGLSQAGLENQQTQSDVSNAQRASQQPHHIWGHNY